MTKVWSSPPGPRRSRRGTGRRGTQETTVSEDVLPSVDHSSRRRPPSTSRTVTVALSPSSVGTAIRFPSRASAGSVRAVARSRRERHARAGGQRVQGQPGSADVRISEQQAAAVRRQREQVDRRVVRDPGEMPGRRPHGQTGELPGRRVAGDQPDRAVVRRQTKHHVRARDRPIAERAAVDRSVPADHGPTRSGAATPPPRVGSARTSAHATVRLPVRATGRPGRRRTGCRATRWRS